MINRLVEFQEFQRLRDEFASLRTWETEYHSRSKEELLAELLDQQHKNYPLAKGNVAEKKQFHALLNVLDRRSQSPWFKQMVRAMRVSLASFYLFFWDRFI